MLRRRYPRRVIQHRPATSVDDLRLAGEVMSRAWRSGSRTVVATPAGIEWWYASSWPEALADHLRLWTDGGDLVAWTWHDAGEIEWFVWTGQPARDVAVLEAILEDAIAASPGAIGIWTAEDDDLTLATLRHHGFEPLGRRLSQWQWHPADGEIATPHVPDRLHDPPRRRPGRGRGSRRRPPGGVRAITPDPRQVRAAGDLSALPLRR